MYHPDIALNLHNAERDRELNQSLLTRKPMHDRPKPQRKGLRRLGHWLALAGSRLSEREASLPEGAKLARVTIRPAQTEDALEIARLSELDERRIPTGYVLVAELNKSIIAAMPLNGGHTVRDPLRPTSDVVELLELRSRQLRLGARDLADAA